MFQLVLFPFVQGAGAPSHQGHIAFEDVEKLRKLIQRGIADDVADPAGFSVPVFLLRADDAGIVLQLEHHAVLDPVFLIEFLLPFLGVHIHGAEFPAPEGAAVLADAGLPEEDGAGVRPFDQRADDEGQEPGDQAADEPADDIDQAFDESLAGGDEADAVGRDAVAPQLAVFPVLPFRFGEGLEGPADDDAHIHKIIDDRSRIGHGIRLEDEDLIHPLMAQLQDGFFAEGNQGDPIVFGSTVRASIEEDEAGDMKIPPDVGAVEAFLRFRDEGRGCEDRQGFLGAVLGMGLLDGAFVDLAQQIIEEDIDEEGGPGLKAGDDLGVVENEEDDQHQDGDVGGHPDDGNHLIEALAAQDPAVTGAEEDDCHLAAGKQQRFKEVSRGVIGEPVMPDDAVG